ncbi:MAG TPA: UDP-N-acetylmuramoyl-tripeptide--D-alanyl-D-alanine ligase [Clostridiales bacterium]|jgi:UDP-N-acetylmuramoyl-tripeptide--D-alanyl-D-alanine ligase|nr:UDP-N-acetylmuramoyl-tripeptide--D-alanyl-D-alanine ligase [Clostridiales bacterium]
MTDTAGFILYTLCFLFAAAVLTKRQMHMFQLNMYVMSVHINWILKDKRGLLRSLPALVAAAFVFVPEIGVYVAAALLVATALLNIQRRAKKPLVVTKRVLRMFATLVILYALFIALAVALEEARMYFYAAFALVLFINPLTVLLSNLIMRPVEKSINLGFIRDAERIIRGMPRLTVIGVTGSYGKTSVKFYIGKLLSAKYNVLVTPESYNTTLGVVRTVRELLRPTHDVFVCEMGAKGVGEIKEICDIVKPKMGIITSIGPQHLETFGSIENIINTKFELEEALPEGGIIFLNTDNEYIAARKVKARRVSYACESEADYRARDIKVSEHGSEFKMTGRDGAEYTFVTKLIGRHNVQNIAGAIAVADTLGVPMEDIAVQVRRLESVPHRLQLINKGRDILIDDAFNSNPSGAKAALSVLGEFSGFKVLITPGMIELGEKQYELNYEFGRQAAEVCDFVALVGERQTKPIHDGLLSAGYDKNKIFVGATIQTALTAVDSLVTNDRKVILLENDLPDNY